MLVSCLLLLALMSFLLRPANIVILVSYLALSALPFAPLILGKPISNPARIVGMEFIAWVTIWGLFKRPAWFHWLLLPAYLALPVELYLHAYFGQGISTHHLGIIAETSPRETIEFLGNKIWLLLAVLLAVVAWWCLTWVAARRTRDLDWADKSRWMILFLLAIAFCVWLYGREIGVRAAPSSKSVSVASSTAEPEADDESASASDDSSEESIASSEAFIKPTLIRLGMTSPDLPKLPSWAQIPFELEPFGKTWPFGLAVHGYDFWKERDYLSELAHKSNYFTFGAHQAEQANTPQIVVMVIGESSRYDRWSLNGYKRETNPLLKMEENLVSLSNVITAVSATRLSVPVLVSRKPATQSLKAGFSEKSFLSAFKEAGFKTYWLSNQMSFGQFDTPISVFANEADVAQFMNLGGFTDNSNYDDVLLDP